MPQSTRVCSKAGRLGHTHLLIFHADEKITPSYLLEKFRIAAWLPCREGYRYLMIAAGCSGENLVSSSPVALSLTCHTLTASLASFIMAGLTDPDSDPLQSSCT